MTFLDAVAALLWADADFKAASPGGIAALVLPEKVTLPATTYRVIGGPTDPTFDTAGLQQLRMEFNCHGSDASSAGAARDALVEALNGPYEARLGDGTWFQGALVISPMDFYDDDSRQFRAMVEFYLYFNPS